MSDIYTKENGVTDSDDYEYPVEEPILFEEEQGGTMFHLKQSYEPSNVNKLICLGCGGDQFNIGKGNYYTAIRCSTCEWEQCIHEG